MANILVDEKCNLKLGDFGLAYQFKGNDDWLQGRCGTPNTLAPEVILSSKKD